jgi:hypothetical protein
LVQCHLYHLKQSPNLYTFKEPRNRFRQAGNRFLGSLKGLQIRALDFQAFFLSLDDFRYFLVIHVLKKYIYFPLKFLSKR